MYAEYIIEWRFNGLNDGEKIADLSQTVFVQSINGAIRILDLDNEGQ